MSTKKTSTTTNQYNPTAENAYNSQVTAGSNALLGEINNPYSNMAFQQQQQMMNLNNANTYGQAQQALAQQLQAQGISSNSPLYQSQLGALTRQNMASQGQGYNSLLLNAANLRQSAINSAMSFNPQQTGQTNVQQTSGLGTWLPQVAGAGLGLATGGLLGGMGGGGGVASNMGGFTGANTQGNYMPSYTPSSSYWGGVSAPATSFGSFGMDSSYNPFLSGGQSVIPGQ